jgi:hypothetical protein
VIGNGICLTRLGWADKQPSKKNADRAKVIESIASVVQALPPVEGVAPTLVRVAHLRYVNLRIYQSPEGYCSSYRPRLGDGITGDHTSPYTHKEQ